MTILGAGRYVASLFAANQPKPSLVVELNLYSAN
jgi:hypothetical protein